MLACKPVTETCLRFIAGLKSSFKNPVWLSGWLRWGAGMGTDTEKMFKEP